MKTFIQKIKAFMNKVGEAIKVGLKKTGLGILFVLTKMWFGIRWFFARYIEKDGVTFVVTFGFIKVKAASWKKFFGFFYHVDHHFGGTDEAVILKFIRFKLTNKRREAIVGYMFIGIWIIGFFWFAFIPLIQSIMYSFSDVIISGDEGIQTTWIGFDNYIQVFSQFTYIEALQEFVVRLVIYLPLILIIGMILAILLNQKIKLRGLFRSTFFLPVIVASGPIMTTLLGVDGNGGLLAISGSDTISEALNNLLPAFLSDAVGNLFAHLISILWFSGVQIILFLAGLQKINKEVYEAASIDGASPWETFWKITLPSLKNIILVAAIYTVVMLATFPNNSVLIRINEARRTDYGYASALSWVYFLIIAVILGVIAFLLTYEKKEKVVKRLVVVKR